jgi:hypothetical protein
MFRRSLLSLTGALTLATPLLFLPSQARADHGRYEHRERHDRWDHRDRRDERDRHDRPELRRIVWQYQGGFFKADGSNCWTESNASGTYHFQEVRRTPDFVDLFDASRGFTVRLYDNAMYLQGGPSYPTFTKLYDGGWTE